MTTLTHNAKTHRINLNNRPEPILRQVRYRRQEVARRTTNHIIDPPELLYRLCYGGSECFGLAHVDLGGDTGASGGFGELLGSLGETVDSAAGGLGQVQVERLNKKCVLSSKDNSVGSVLHLHQVS